MSSNVLWEHARCLFQSISWSCFSRKELCPLSVSKTVLSQDRLHPLIEPRLISRDLERISAPSLCHTLVYLVEELLARSQRRVFSRPDDWVLVGVVREQPGGTGLSGIVQALNKIRSIAGTRFELVLINELCWVSVFSSKVTKALEHVQFFDYWAMSSARNTFEITFPKYATFTSWTVQLGPMKNLFC